jgi:hypothetical protein
LEDPKIKELRETKWPNDFSNKTRQMAGFFVLEDIIDLMLDLIILNYRLAMI